MAPERAVDLASIQHRTEYWRRGRTPDKLGVERFCLSALVHVNEGVRPDDPAGLGGKSRTPETAVADGRWSRVGSTNLNVASWIGNWELDVAIEDPHFARAMEETYVADLNHATEIVLAGRRVRPRPGSAPSRRSSATGSVGRVAAGTLGLGSTVSTAIGDRRALGPAEAKVLGVIGLLLLLVSAVALLWPRLFALPLAAAGIVLAVALLVRAWRLKARHHADVPGLKR